MAKQPEAKEMKFEQALRTLEEITQKITGGTESLDELLVLYEEGIQYLKICREKLAEAELKVQQLNERLGKDMPQEDGNG